MAKDEHRNVLRRARLVLVDHFLDGGQDKFMSFIDHIGRTPIITPYMKDDIVSEPRLVTKIRKLLDLIPKRGPDAWRTFIKSLIFLNYSTDVTINLLTLCSEDISSFYATDAQLKACSQILSIN